MKESPTNKVLHFTPKKNVEFGTISHYCYAPYCGAPLCGQFRIA